MTALVYWLLDADDHVLYVGLTMSPKARMDCHAHTKPWWPQVASVATTEYMPRSEAARIEAEDIRRIQPPHNVEHKNGQSAIQMARKAWLDSRRRAAIPAA